MSQNPLSPCWPFALLLDLSGLPRKVARGNPDFGRNGSKKHTYCSTAGRARRAGARRTGARSGSRAASAGTGRRRGSSGSCRRGSRVRAPRSRRSPSSTRGARRGTSGGRPPPRRTNTLSSPSNSESGPAPQEARSILLCPSREKFCAVVLQGGRNYFCDGLQNAPMKFLA